MSRSIGHIQGQIEKQQKRLLHLQKIKQEHVLRGVLSAENKNAEAITRTIQRLERLGRNARNPFQQLLLQNNDLRQELIRTEKARLSRIRRRIASIQSRLDKKKKNIERKGSEGYRLQLFQDNPSLLDQTIESIRKIIMTHKQMKHHLLKREAK